MQCGLRMGLWAGLAAALALAALVVWDRYAPGVVWSALFLAFFALAVLLLAVTASSLRRPPGQGLSAPREETPPPVVPVADDWGRKVLEEPQTAPSCPEEALAALPEENALPVTEETARSRPAVPPRAEATAAASREEIGPLLSRAGAADTPLGRLVAEAWVGSATFHSRTPEETQVLAGHGRILSWRTDQCRLELLWTPFVPELPDGLRVSGCLALIWRVRAEKTLGQVAFECRLEGLPPDVRFQREEIPEVEAGSWSQGQSLLTLGTEGETGLDRRAWKGKGVPPRLAPRLHPGMIVFHDGALRVSLPPLLRGERCQIHFIAAWSRQGGADNLAPRAAVELLGDMEF